MVVPAFANLKTRDFRGHREKVHTVGWNSDGRYLASGSVDTLCKVWLLEKAGRDPLDLKGHTSNVDQLVWHPSHPELLATASQDKSVRFWDVRAGKCTGIVQTPGENINISWSPDGNCIAVGNKDDHISFIDSKKLRIEKEIPFRFEVNEITWNLTGDLFLLTTSQGTINVLEYPSLKEVHIVNAHPSNCFCIKFDPKGRYFATGSADALVSLWDVEEFACLKTFGKLDWPVRTIGFSYDGEYIASGSEDLVIDISSIETGESVHQISCLASTNSLAFHPSKFLLAYAGDKEGDRDQNLRVFGFTS